MTRATRSSARAATRPGAASAKTPLVVTVAVQDPELEAPLVAAGARLGLDVRTSRDGARVVVGVDDTLSHVLRAEALSATSGAIDLVPEASARTRRALEGLVGVASARSIAIVREEADGRLSLSLRNRLPVDLGEPPEAAAALRAARARRVDLPPQADLGALPEGAEARARAITFGPTRTLSDPSSRRVLEAFGIACAPWRLAENAARAAAHARAIGYPVDLRIASPDVSAIDEPRFGAYELRTPGEVREAFRSIAREVRRTAPDARTLGVTVARHEGSVPRLRLAISERRLRVEMDDPIGRSLTRPMTMSLPEDAEGAAASLARFGGFDALPRFESPAGRALLDVVVRFARLAFVLADTLTSAEIAPLVPAADAWAVLGARLSVRGVDA